MLYIPTMPKWNGLHVLIVHFPIALLMVAPLFVLLAAIIPAYRKGLALSAMVLLLGTVGAWLATATGGAAAHQALAHPTWSSQYTRDQIRHAIHHHAALGELTRDAFTILSILFFIMLMVPLFKKIKTNMIVAALIVFVVLCLPGMFLIVDTGDAGGMLVHKYGLRADVFSSSASLTDSAAKAPKAAPPATPTKTTPTNGG